MSIPAKRRRSLGEEVTEEGQDSEYLTPQTPTTITESIATASASATLTPLTAMDTPEAGQDESKSVPPTAEEGRAKTPQEPSWKGWAELENDPVSSSNLLVFSVL